jgi:hypothetical protein
MVAGALGRERNARNVGAARFLGHELRAADERVQVLAEHAGQVALLHALVAVFLNQKDRGVGDRQRT